MDTPVADGFRSGRAKRRQQRLSTLQSVDAAMPLPLIQPFSPETINPRALPDISESFASNPLPGIVHMEE